MAVTVNVNQAFKNREGKELRILTEDAKKLIEKHNAGVKKLTEEEYDNLEHKPITFKNIVCNILDATIEKDKDETIELRRSRVKLSNKIYDAEDNVDLNVDEIVLIKNRVYLCDNYMLEAVLNILGE